MSPEASIFRPSLLSIGRKTDRRGNLSVLQAGSPLPFAIRRVYWINDVPGGACRFGRALRSQWEAIVALSGSVKLEVQHGAGNFMFHLSSPDLVAVLPPLSWRIISDFTTNAAVLVVASGEFDENDYIRDYSEFKTAVNGY